MAPKRESPSAVPGGGGEVPMSAEAHPGALFFECLFLNAFSDALFEASDVFLEVLGVYFASLWGTFLNFWPSK